MTSLKTIILDFDGVVIESNALKTQTFEKIFGRFPEYAAEMLRFHAANVSLSRYKKFDHLLELLGRKHDQPLREDIAADFSQRMIEGMVTVPLVTGALSFLQTITAHLPIYLASVTPETELRTILDQRKLAKWFTGIYGCPPWTKPAAIADVLKRENLTASDALLIGDSAGDQSAAMLTGVSFLARNSGLQFEEPYPTCFPDLDALSDYIQTTLL
jgi:phosphoglycolate phosphatase-like HAD superfamily hydrolase